MAEFDLLRFMDRAEFMADANCRGLDPSLFFPSEGQDQSQAKSICRECDVQAECLAWALNNAEHYGIWGGMSERERRRIRRAQPGAPRRGPIPPPSELVRHEHGTVKGYRQHYVDHTKPCDACRNAYIIDAQYSRGPRSVTA